MLGGIFKLGLLATVVVLIGLVLFRPATLFGVDSKALANSLSAEARHAQANCVGEGAGRWRCLLHGGTLNGVEYALATDRYGCWDGTRIARPGSTVPAGSGLSGCIGLTDMLGD
jgi:hypothetical protein